MLSTEMLVEMAPRWDATVRAIHNDKEANEDLGWVQEMFGFTLALANAPGGPPHVRLHPKMMAQPPFDTELMFDPCEVRCPPAVHVL
jgi:hypothetical protein